MKPRPPWRAASVGRGVSGAEELEDQLRVLVGDAERLDAELLLGLQCLQLGRGLVHIGIDERADAGCDRVAQIRREGRLQVDALAA